MVPEIGGHVIREENEHRVGEAGEDEDAADVGDFLRSELGPPTADERSPKRTMKQKTQREDHPEPSEGHGRGEGRECGDDQHKHQEHRQHENGERQGCPPSNV